MSKPEVLLTEAVLNLNPRPDASRKTWMTPTDFTVKVTRNNTRLTNQETGVGEAGVTVTCLRDRGLSTESPAMLIFLCLPKASLKECIHSAPSRGARLLPEWRTERQELLRKRVGWLEVCMTSLPKQFWNLPFNQPRFCR